MESDFDSYMLIPQYSELTSRKEITTDTLFTKKHLLYIPIVSSPMNTVTEYAMAWEMAILGGVGVIHRYMTIEEQGNIVKKLKSNGGFGVSPIAASISINNQEKRIETLINSGVDILTLDVAHGDMKQCYDLVKSIKSYSDVDIVSGNIVTPEAAERYYEVGIDTFRVGIGGGSGCITRNTAGVGYNQLLSIKEIHERIREIPIISDGGIRYSGDIVKALAAGANTVFVGRLLAAAKESPAERYSHRNRNGVFPGKDGHSQALATMECLRCKDLGISENKYYVKYAGMASEYAERRRIERTGEEASDIIHLDAPEGQEVYIEDKEEKAKTIIDRLVQGLKIGMAYMGAKTILELQQKAKWVKL